MRWTEEQLAEYQAKRKGLAPTPETTSRRTAVGSSNSGVGEVIRQSRREYHDYKDDFLKQIQRLGLPMPSHGQGCEVKELHFAQPRLWRFDWAYESQRIAIEYQGGNYIGKGGHNTVKGLKNDYEKFTEAALRGWMLILIDCKSVEDGRAVTWVERALRARMRDQEVLA